MAATGDVRMTDVYVVKPRARWPRRPCTYRWLVTADTHTHTKSIVYRARPLLAEGDRPVLPGKKCVFAHCHIPPCGVRCGAVNRP